jgi:hypothetical protein
MVPLDVRSDSGEADTRWLHCRPAPIGGIWAQNYAAAFYAATDRAVGPGMPLSRPRVFNPMNSCHRLVFIRRSHETACLAMPRDAVSYIDRKVSSAAALEAFHASCTIRMEKSGQGSNPSLSASVFCSPKADCIARALRKARTAPEVSPVERVGIFPNEFRWRKSARGEKGFPHVARPPLDGPPLPHGDCRSR